MAKKRTIVGKEKLSKGIIIARIVIILLIVLYLIMKAYTQSLGIQMLVELVTPK